MILRVLHLGLHWTEFGSTNFALLGIAARRFDGAFGTDTLHVK